MFSLVYLTIIWSLPSFKALFAEGGALYKTTLLFKVPFLHGEVVKAPLVASAQTTTKRCIKIVAFFRIFFLPLIY
jgi:lactate permease